MIPLWQLSEVPTEVLNSRQNFVDEMPIRRHFALPRRDSHVCLVDPQSLGLLRPLVFNFIFLRRTDTCNVRATCRNTGVLTGSLRGLCASNTIIELFLHGCVINMPFFQ